MPFLNRLQVEPVPGTDKRRLLVSLCYMPHDQTIAIEVPAGFMTNYASVPRALWSLFRPDAGDTRRAATIHDYLYWQHLYYSRRQVDKIFRQALKDDGAGFFKRWTMWAAVRAGGWAKWQD